MDEQTPATSEPAPKKSFPTALIAVVLLLAVGGIAFAFTQNTNKPASKGQSEQTQTPEPTTVQEENIEEETVTAGQVQEFSVNGSNFKFSVSEIKVKKGDTVMITFNNSGGVHDFVIDEFDVRSKQLQSGQSETIEFVADKTGTFEYYCSIGNHRAMGMKGNLIVE